MPRIKTHNLGLLDREVDLYANMVENYDLDENDPLSVVELELLLKFAVHLYDSISDLELDLRYRAIDYNSGLSKSQIGELKNLTTLWLLQCDKINTMIRLLNNKRVIIKHSSEFHSRETIATKRCFTTTKK